MNDDVSGAPAAEPAPPAASSFALRRVAPATAEERRMREEGMARALKVGAAPYRDAEGNASYVFFKEANNAPVEAWRRDPRAKRGYRRTQEVRKAAGQLIGQPGDMIEIAKRLGELHYREGSDIEGAAARGLHDAIWSREHVYETFTVPRRYGLSLMETGRIAAVAEEEARRLQAADPKARGGFWVRDRRNTGLIYVVPNAEPETETAAADAAGMSGAAPGEDDVLVGGQGDDVVVGQAEAASEPAPVGATGAGAPPMLNYPNIPLPALERTWEVPEGTTTDDAELPVINMEKDRIKNILANEPALFEIKDWPNAKPGAPPHEFHSAGYGAVQIFQDVIEYEANLQGVDVNLVKAIMYFENARGASYGQPLEAIDKIISAATLNFFDSTIAADSILPMNIKVSVWGGLVQPGESLKDPLVNVKAGVTLIRRIIERLEDPTVAKVASVWHFTGMENVMDDGAHVATIYEDRAWEREPESTFPQYGRYLQEQRDAVRRTIPSSAP